MLNVCWSEILPRIPLAVDLFNMSRSYFSMPGTKSGSASSVLFIILASQSYAISDFLYLAISKSDRLVKAMGANIQSLLRSEEVIV